MGQRWAGCDRTAAGCKELDRTASAGGARQCRQARIAADGTARCCVARGSEVVARRAGCMTRGDHQRVSTQPGQVQAETNVQQCSHPKAPM